METPVRYHIGPIIHEHQEYFYKSVQRTEGVEWFVWDSFWERWLPGGEPQYIVSSFDSLEDMLENEMHNFPLSFVQLI